MKQALTYKSLIYTLVLTTIFQSTDFMDPINSPKLSVLGLGALLLLIALIINVKYLKTDGLSHFKYILAVFIVSMLVSGLATSTNFNRIIMGVFGRNNGLLSYAALAVVAYGSAVTVKNYGHTRIIKSLAVLGFLESLYGIMQINRLDFFQFSYVGNPVFLTLGNEDFASVFLVISIFANVYLLFENSKDFKQIFFLLSISTQLFVLLQINTAQSRIGIFLGLGIFALYLLNIPSFSARTNFHIKVVLVLFGLIASVAGFLSVGPLKFLHSNINSLYSRYMHWLEGWYIFKQHPFFGIGIDSYGDYQPFFKVRDLNGIADTYTNNAHNLFFQFLPTVGLVTFLPFIAFLVFLSLSLFRISVNPKIPNTLKALLSSVNLAFLINILVGIDNLGVVIWFWMFSGVTVAIDQKYGKADQATSKVVSAKTESATLSSKLAVASLTVCMLISNIYALKENGVSYLINRSYKAVLKNDNTDNALARIYGLGNQTDDPDLKMYAIRILYSRGQFEKGYDLAKDAHEISSRNLPVLDALAIYHEYYKNIPKAIEYRKLMVSLDPLNDVIIDKLSKLENIS